MKTDSHPAAGGRRAAFLDRDGTIIRDAHYLSDPAKVILIPGAAAALARLAKAGYALVVVTNQSGIARGMFTEEDYQAVRARMDALLAAEGVRLDASYHCPHHPDFGARCECRKPGHLLFDRATRDLGLAPHASVFIGDRYRDIAPALHYGARAILVPTDETPVEDLEMAHPQAAIVGSLDEAVKLVLTPERG